MTTSYAALTQIDVQTVLQHYAHKLRPRQLAILEFVYTFIQAEGHAPTLREIGDAVGISSTSVVNYNIKQLTQWHFLQQGQWKSRSVWLTPAGYRVLDQLTPQEIEADRLRLVIENRRLQERCRQLERRCRDLLHRAAS